MICIEMATYPLEPREDPCCDPGMFQYSIYTYTLGETTKISSFQPF